MHVRGAVEPRHPGHREQRSDGEAVGFRQRTVTRRAARALRQREQRDVLGGRPDVGERGGGRHRHGLGRRRRSLKLVCIK